MMAIDWEQTNDTCMLRLDSIGYSLSPSLRTFSQLVICWKVENKSQHKYIRYSVKKHSIKLIKCILILACMSITPYVTFLLRVCSIPGCVYGNYNINTVCHTLPYVC